MKKALLAVICFLLVFSAFSQNEEDRTDRYTDRCVILKWAPGSLIAGKLTLGGEYNFKKKNSLEMFLGFPTAMDHKFDYDNSTSSLSTQAFSFFAGYRYYFGKRPHSGLYVEPYYKYLHHQLNGFLNGDVNGEAASFDTHTDYKGMGVGAQIGFQFLIAKRICFDFFILGPEANSVKFYSTSTDVSSSIPWTVIEADEAEQDIKDALNNIPVIGDKIEVSVDQNTRTVSTKYKGFAPGFRFGASIGIRL